ncbi:MAG: glycosyltransferase 87 family protein, partial [Pseudomonadota bacterium]
GRAGAVVGAVGRAGASGGAVGRAGAVGGAVQRVAAGLAMAALVVKPQLALAMPLAAVAAGAWRTVAVAAAATVAALAAATLVTGTGYWAALLGALAEHDAGIRGAGGYQAEVARHGYLDLSITPYAWLRGRGLADGAALALHGALGLAGLSVAAVGWRALARRADRQDRTGSDAPSVNDSSDDGRLAHALIALTLMLSVLLPHRALFYEATFFVAAALCLARAGAGATLAGRAAILVAFVAVPRPLLEALGLPVGGSTVPGLVAAAAYAAWLVLRLVRVDAAGTEAAVGAGGPSGVAGPAPAEAASPAGQAGGSAV